MEDRSVRARRRRFILRLLREMQSEREQKRVTLEDILRLRSPHERGVKDRDRDRERG